MTKKQFEALMPFEHYFDTAVNNDYVRSMPRQSADTIARYYIELKLGSSANLACPKCVLDICKTVGKLYFTYKTKQSK